MKWILTREKWFNPSIVYFLGQDVDEGGVLLIEDGKKHFLCSPLSEIKLKGVKVEKNSKEKFWKLIEKEKVVGLDFQNNSANFIEKIRKKVEVEDISEKINEMREQKKHNEVKKIKEAEKMTKEIFDIVEKNIYEGVSEINLKKRIIKEMLEMDGSPAFEPIVLFGKNASIPHNVASNKKLRNGENVLIDMGIKKEFYCADLTRCYRLGTKQKVYEDLIELVGMLKKEKNTKKINEITDEFLKNKNYPKMIHNIGHGIGIEVHEMPHFTIKGEKIPEGAVLCLEPAVYYPDWGIRYEEMIYY